MADHIAQEKTNVAVAAGLTTTQNFDLRWLQPCVNTATKTLQVTMDLNATHSETILFANAAQVPASFGFTSVPASRRPQLAACPKTPGASQACLPG